MCALNWLSRIVHVSLARWRRNTHASREDPSHSTDSNRAELKYWAFISYSHHDEHRGRWGTRLHTALESYRVPKQLVGRDVAGVKVPQRIHRVFLDREELASGPSLPDKIRQTLEQSRYLVVICSPFAAASRWVNEEVRTFKAIGREDRVLPLIIGGEPNATDKPDSGMPECFPEALRFRVAASGELT